MTTKEKVLEFLEKNRGNYFSGQDLASKIYITRSGIWKAVKQLREEGYPIEATTNKGYCLLDNSDKISPQGIKKYLSLEYESFSIYTYKETSSTNDVCRQFAQNMAEEGTVIVAEEQQCGRGRQRRAFFSPKDTGVYFSILLRPENGAIENSLKITTMAAVALCDVVRLLSGKSAGIKWVNDVFIDGRKIGGILSEASVGVEDGRVEYVILGVGVNLYIPNGGFPSEISESAGSVLDAPQTDARNRTVAEFINRFMKIYKSAFTSAAPSVTKASGAARSAPSSPCTAPASPDSTASRAPDCPPDCDYIEAYRKMSIVIGKKISFVKDNIRRTATATDIDDSCRLIVSLESGEQMTLSYGEVKIEL